MRHNIQTHGSTGNTNASKEVEVIHEIQKTNQ